MRSFGRRVSSLVVLGVLSTGVVAAGLAFACSPSANIGLGSLKSGVAGSQVVVSGDSFPASGRVELRWGSATGPLLATATGPSFSTTATIPQAAPGVYAIKAVGFNADGSSAGAGPATTFEVTPSPSTAPAANPQPAGQNPAPTPAKDPAPAAATADTQSAAPVTSGPANSTPAKSTPAKSAARPSKSNPAKAATPAKKSSTSRPAASKAVVKAPARSRPAPADTPSSANPPVVRTQTGRAVFGGSVTPAAPAANKARTTARGGRAEGQQPAKAAAVAPLIAPKQPTGKSPSLLPSAADPQMQQSGPGSTLMIGLGLLGVGLVAMFAGALVVEVRRRRAPVAQQRTRKH